MWFQQLFKSQAGFNLCKGKQRGKQTSFLSVLSWPSIFPHGVVVPCCLPNPAGLHWRRFPPWHPQIRWYIVSPKLTLQFQLLIYDFQMMLYYYFFCFVLINITLTLICPLIEGRRGLGRLRYEVSTCEYDDVRVMWEMLSRREDTWIAPVEPHQQAATLGALCWPQRWATFHLCRSF